MITGPIHHTFVALDEGLGRLLFIDEREPFRNWIAPIGKLQARDMQLVGEIVWEWSRPEMISSLQGVLVLDGLDTFRLHDERDGLVKPIE